MNRYMKILFVNEYASPNIVSGAELSMESLARSLIDSGHKVAILSANLSEGENLRYEKKIKFLKFWFPKKCKPYSSLPVFWFDNPIFWLCSVIPIALAVWREKPDIIHVHGKYMLPGTIISKLFFSKPIIVTVRDYKFICPLAICLTRRNKACTFSYFLGTERSMYLSKYTHTSIVGRIFISARITISKLLQQGLYFFLTKCNAIVYVSNALAQIYEKSGFSKSKLSVIYNFCQPKPLSIKPIDRKIKIVLYVGKLSYGKGTDILIEAMEKVRKILPKVKLMLIGSKSQSIDNIPSWVDWILHIPNEKIFDYYRQASVFVLPTRWPEPLSRSGLEALSMGLPVIASDRGGNREIVNDSKNGYLIEPNVETLANKISSLLNNDFKIIEMGKESFKLSKKRFSAAMTIEKHIKLYKRLLE